MSLIEEISFGVISEFRENQKGKLQRHFVSGEDTSKVNLLLILQLGILVQNCLVVLSIS